MVHGLSKHDYCSWFLIEFKNVLYIGAKRSYDLDQSLWILTFTSVLTSPFWCSESVRIRVYLKKLFQVILQFKTKHFFTLFLKLLCKLSGRLHCILQKLIWYKAIKGEKWSKICRMCALSMLMRLLWICIPTHARAVSVNRYKNTIKLNVTKCHMKDLKRQCRYGQSQWFNLSIALEMMISSSQYNFLPIILLRIKNQTVNSVKQVDSTSWWKCMLFWNRTFVVHKHYKHAKF